MVEGSSIGQTANHTMVTTGSMLSTDKAHSSGLMAGYTLEAGPTVSRMDKAPSLIQMASPKLGSGAMGNLSARKMRGDSLVLIYIILSLVIFKKSVLKNDLFE